ncbi:MAG: DUF262 domain-containing protein, partial [bacterium]|nr:DUF262 domain-containing protein [bacterium]
VDYVVLDGQQRLTSLFHALRGYGDEAWILDSSELAHPASSSSVDQIEEAVKPIGRSEWDTEYPLIRQGEEMLIPLVTLASPTEYFEWRDAVVEAAPSGGHKPLRVHLTETCKSLLSRVHDYSFPAVILQAGLEIEAIARIFERINRTGLRLTTFDLMVARTYTTKWNLRDEWENALTDLPLLGDFMDDGLAALQVVSLLEQEDIRQPAVLKSTPEQVRAEFRNSCEALAAAYEWLIHRCGVRRPEWIPYNVMPIVIGALAARGLLETRTEELESWFWLSVMSQRFDVGSSTQAAADFKSIRDANSVDYPGMREGTLTVAANPLVDGTRRKMGPFWRGFSCAIGHGPVLDPLTGQSLVNDQVGLLADRTDLRSIFPSSAAVAGRSPVHLLVLGNFLATRSTSKLLAGKPAKWTGAQLHEEGLTSQLLPPSSELDGLLLDSSALIADRLERLRRFVSERAGVTVLTV